MAFGYRRTDLQAIARAKLEDALLLFKHGRFSNAYYLAGYAVEIGLKACIARQIVAETIPDRHFISETYRHELNKLIGAAGLTADLKAREQRSPAFAANWSTVAEWSPEKRYESIDSYSAQFMIEAVNEPENGVFPWIKIYW
jgi:HEPN domain-containing protein